MAENDRRDAIPLAATAIALLALGWPFSHIYRWRREMSLILAQAADFYIDIALIAGFAVATGVVLWLGRRLVDEAAYWRLRIALLALAGLHFLRFFVPALAEVVGWKPSSLACATIAGALLLAVCLGPWRRPLDWRPRWRSVEVFALIVGVILLANGVVHTRFHDNHLRRAPAPRAPEPYPEVYFIVLDSLGYDVLFPEGHSSPRYPAFRALGTVSHVFHQVSAPDLETAKSIPKLLAGASVTARYRDIDFAYELRSASAAQEPFEPFAARPSLFRQFAATHHLRILGYGLPYCDFAQSFAYRCDTFSYYPANLASALLPATWYEPHQYRQMLSQEKAFFDRLDEPVVNRFYYAHFFAPHAAYIFHREGLRPDYHDNNASTAENFGHQVDYVDALLGRIFGALRHLGKLDSALVVVTADHGPEYLPYAQRGHVPLFIKLPGQKQGVNHRQAASTLHLKDAIWQAAHTGRFDPDVLALARLTPSDRRLTDEGSRLTTEERTTRTPNPNPNPNGNKDPS